MDKRNYRVELIVTNNRGTEAECTITLGQLDDLVNKAGVSGLQCMLDAVLEQLPDEENEWTMDEIADALDVPVDSLTIKK